MVTGASTANLALLLIDARKGVLEQTRRHALLSSLLARPAPRPLRQQNGPGRLRPAVYDEIREEFTTFAAKLDITRPELRTDLGAGRRQRGRAVTEHALVPRASRCSATSRTFHIASDRNLVDNRFPVQYVIRPQSAEYRDYRGFAGSVVGGIFNAGRRGDGDAVAQSARRSPRSTPPKGRSTQAFPPMAVTLRLEDDVDVSRGDLICRPVQPAVDEPPLRRADLLVRRHLAPAHRHPVSAEAHDEMGGGRDRAAALPARRRHPARRPRRGDARGQRDRPRLRSRPPRRSSSTPTGSTARPAASSSSTPAPT